MQTLYKLTLTNKNTIISRNTTLYKLTLTNKNTIISRNTTLYKLTNKNMQTYGGCQWVLNEEKTASGEGDLCTAGWLHAYTHPLLAALLNLIHADFPAPRLFKAQGTVGKTDGQLKVGCTKLTLTEELPLPEITTNQRIRFAILCAQQVVSTTCPEWSKWAAGWLSGEDRSQAAAQAAAAVRSAAAARSAAARSAAQAAWAAGTAAEAAQWAWTAAEAAGKELDLVALAEQAIREEK